MLTGVLFAASILAAVLLWDYVYPRWIYEYKRKKHGCGPIQKHLGWPFGFVNAYRAMRLIRECNALKRYTPPACEQTQLHQVNTFFIIETAEPENMKALLSTQFSEYDLSRRHEILSPLMGDGIFTVQGEVWRQQRGLLRPIFARERVSKLDMLEKHFQALSGKIKSTQGFLDMQPIFFNFTLGTSLHFLFDFDFNCFDSRVPQIPTTKGPVPASELFKALARSSEFLAIRRVLARIEKVVYTSQFRKDLELVHSFSDAIVDRVINDEKNDCFIAQAAKVNPDKKFLRDQAFTMFIAGRSTTASFLTHLVLDLSRFPDKWAKLREAVTTEIGTTASDITFEKLKRCSYLSNCLNESLRLHPNVPLNVRGAKHDTTLPRGGGPDGSQPIFVPKGTHVQYNVYGLQRNPALWGEDANEFRPERWDGHKSIPWTYLPFNGGPRTCLGQQFALNEAGYVMARLCQEFPSLEASEAIKKGDYKFAYALTIKVSPSVDVKWS